MRFNKFMDKAEETWIWLGPTIIIGCAVAGITAFIVDQAHPNTATPTSIPTHTKLTFYTAQTLTYSSFHVLTPSTIAMRITLISGGGGGMGSQANMVFNDTTNPIPYQNYGKMGTESCWDTHPQAAVSFVGSTVTWPNHPFHPTLDDDNPIFFTTLGTLPGNAVVWKTYYLIGSSIAPNSFAVSDKPYNPPGVPAFPPRVPSNWTGSGTGVSYANAYKRCVTGGSGGGIIGDQGLTGHSIGTRFGQNDWWYQSGGNGDCAIGGGGRGGGDQGAITQYGTLFGNRGNDLGGGGGSGGGMGQNYTVIGPCGGGTGAVMKISVKPADMKQYTYFLAGVGGAGGAAGPGGWDGGAAGNGSVLVEEDLP